MALFTVDNTKCKKDRLCVMECPMAIPEMKDKTGCPEPAKGREKLCLNCGHCVAVCPAGALSLETMKSDECEPVSSNWNPGYEAIDSYLKYRRAIRKFKKDPVEKDKLLKLINMATYAPSGHNARPVEWTVISERENVKQAALSVVDWMRDMIEKKPDEARLYHFDIISKAWDNGIDTITWGAPSLIIAHGMKADPMAFTGCTIALSHADIAAPSLGLGCCWGGFITWCSMSWKPLKERLGLPKEHALYGSLLTGYPLLTYHRVPKRKTVVHWQ
jgi:nitroreductase/NAD-dependent dihydropyrimidine dehydrogenase PreA subunit